MVEGDAHQALRAAHHYAQRVIVRAAHSARRAPRRKRVSLRARERASCTPLRGGGIIAFITAMTGVSSRS
jgi:hypothetical protein